MKLFASEREREIKRLKLQAARALRALQSRTHDLDCGWSLACQIRPELPKLKQTFDDTMAALARIDPEAAELLKRMKDEE